MTNDTICCWYCGYMGNEEEFKLQEAENLKCPLCKCSSMLTKNGEFIGTDDEDDREDYLQSLPKNNL